jgi:hypothetical protein
MEREATNMTTKLNFRKGDLVSVQQSNRFGDVKYGEIIGKEVGQTEWQDIYVVQYSNTGIGSVVKVYGDRLERI